MPRRVRHLTKSLQLDPDRAWAKSELEKTPAQ